MAGSKLSKTNALLQSARAGVENDRLTRINGAERDKSGRAQCRHCTTTIAKGAWRILLVINEEGRFMRSGFIHPRCAPGYFEAKDVDVMPRVQRFAKGLTQADLAEVGAELRAGS